LSKDSPLEKNLKEATSDKNWGCPTTILSEIARCSFNCTDYLQIMKFLWTALSEPPKKWRRIYKALTLLEYLLKNGCERVVEETRENQFALRVLQQFSFTEEGRDKGAGIREKAKLVCRLAFDPELLKEERETAQKNRNKFVGIGARGERTGSGFSASGSSSSFSSSSASFSSFSSSGLNSLGTRMRAGELHTAGRPFGAARPGALSPAASKSRDERQSPANFHRGETEDSRSSDRRASPAGKHAHASKSREEEKKERKKGTSKKKEDKEETEKNRRRHRSNEQITPSDDLLALDEPPSSSRPEGGSAVPAFPTDSLFGNDDNWGNFTAAPAAACAPSGSRGNALPPELFPSSLSSANPWSNPTVNGASNGGTATDFFGSFQAAPQPATTGVASAASAKSVDFFAEASQPPPAADRNPFASAAPSTASQAPKEGFFADSRFAMVNINLTDAGTQARTQPAAGATFGGVAAPAFAVSGPGLNANRAPAPTGFGDAGASPAVAAPAFSTASAPGAFPPAAAGPFCGQAASVHMGNAAASQPSFPQQPTPPQGGGVSAFPPAFGAFQAAPAFGALGSGVPSAGGVGGAALFSQFPGSPATTGF
ncbi:ENTH domain-containing protein, partial [Toxoplasma gondii FOU]